MGGKCSTHRRDKKFVRIFIRKTQMEEKDRFVYKLNLKEMGRDDMLQINSLSNYSCVSRGTADPPHSQNYMIHFD
jgi:hypothetical protein